MAYDIVTRRCRDPQIDVGQPTGQFDYGPRKGCYNNEEVEEALLQQGSGRAGPPAQSRSASPGAQSSNAFTTSSSIVCLGPVNHLLAEICHHRTSRIRVPIVRMGA